MQGSSEKTLLVPAFPPARASVRSALLRQDDLPADFPILMRRGMDIDVEIARGQIGLLGVAQGRLTLERAGNRVHLALLTHPDQDPGIRAGGGRAMEMG